MLRIALFVAAALALTACVTKPAKSADRICAELRKQDPQMLHLAAANWHMVPDEARRMFKGPRAFLAKMRACRIG